MKTLFKKILNWWRSKMLDRVCAKYGLLRKHSKFYDPFCLGYQPDGDGSDVLPKPPKGGTSQACFDKNFKILSEKISDDGKHVEMIIEAKPQIQKITIEGVIKP